MIARNSSTDGWAEWMPGTDMPCTKGPGCDGNCTEASAVLATAHDCQAVCTANASCVGWSFVDRSRSTPPAKDLCCQKRRIDGKQPSQTVTSGVKRPTILEHTKTSMRLLADRSQSSTAPLGVGVGAAAGSSSAAAAATRRARPHEGDTIGAALSAAAALAVDDRSRMTFATDVPLSAAEAKAGCCDTVTVRVLVDNSVIEAYAMQGRAHLATRAYPANVAASDMIGVAWVPLSDESGRVGGSSRGGGEGEVAAVTADIVVWEMGDMQQQQ